MRHNFKVLVEVVVIRGGRPKYVVETVEYVRDEVGLVLRNVRNYLLPNEHTVIRIVKNVPRNSSPVACPVTNLVNSNPGRVGNARTVGSGQLYARGIVRWTVKEGAKLGMYSPVAA